MKKAQNILDINLKREKGGKNNPTKKHAYATKPNRKATKAKPRMKNTKSNALESRHLHEKQSKEMKQIKHHQTLSINNLANSPTKGRPKMDKRSAKYLRLSYWLHSTSQLIDNLPARKELAA